MIAIAILLTLVVVLLAASYVVLLRADARLAALVERVEGIEDHVVAIDWRFEDDADAKRDALGNDLTGTFGGHPATEEQVLKLAKHPIGQDDGFLPCDTLSNEDFPRPAHPMEWDAPA